MRSRYLPKGFYLPWSLFLEELERLRPGSGYVENRYRESILFACKDHQDCFGDVFDYYVSNMLDQLYELTGLCTITVNASIAPSTAFITHIVRWFQNKSKVIFEQGGIPKRILYVIEDATILTDEGELGTTSPLVEMSFISRVYRQGFIFSGHNIGTSFSKKLLSTMESVIVFGISETSRVIQNVLLCSESQAQVIPTLKPGEFVALIPSFHPRAVPGRYPFIRPPRKLSEMERQDIVGPFLEKVRAVKYISRQLPPITRISQNPKIQKVRLEPDELQVLTTAGTGKYLPKTRLYDQLKLNRRRGKQISDKLEKLGLIRDCYLGRICVLEVSEDGKKIISDLGFQPKAMDGGGGFKHAVGVESVEEDQKKKGYSTKREVDVFGNRLDLESFDSRTGQKTFFNIGVTDPVREAVNILSILKTPIVQNNHLIFVARDTVFAHAVHKALKEKDPTGQWMKQVEIKTIADYMTAE